jgi:hypothetical protein
LLASFESLPQLSNPLLMLDPPLSGPFFQKLAQEQVCKYCRANGIKVLNYQEHHHVNI